MTVKSIMGQAAVCPDIPKSVPMVKFYINRTVCLPLWAEVICSCTNPSLQDMRWGSIKRQVIIIEHSIFLIDSRIQVGTFSNTSSTIRLFMAYCSDWWQDFSKPDANEFYRTVNQEYGRYKPLTHHMPTVYRTKSNAFTQVNIAKKKF